MEDDEDGEDSLAPEDKAMSAVSSVKAFIEVVRYKLSPDDLYLKTDAPDTEFINEMATAD